MIRCLLATAVALTAFSAVCIADDQKPASPPTTTGKAAPKTVSIGYNTLKTSADIEVGVGDKVNVIIKFSGDIGLLEEPLNQPTVSITDGKSGEVISGTTTFAVKRLDKNTVQFWTWDAKRAGTAEITFKNSLNGKTVKTIKVTVKP